MASSPLLSLAIAPRGKFSRPLPKTIEIAGDAKTADLYHALSSKTGLSIHQLRASRQDDKSKAIPNSPDVRLDQLQLHDHDVVLLKDLGRQISWRAVFIIEYAGPIFIHLLVYYLRLSPHSPLAPASGNVARASTLQKLCLAMILIHFAKREYESIFVHRFSAATMPFHTVFKNSAHYWLLSGLAMAWQIYSPTGNISVSMLRPELDSVFSFVPLAGMALFAIGELGNLFSHLKLRSLRRAGTTERQLPTGFPLFDLIACPNYFFEFLAWFGVLMVSRSSATALFLGVSSVQMAIWARKKDARYRREFPDTYRAQWAMFPHVV